MTIAFRSFTTFSITGAGNLIATVPAGVVNGDGLILLFDPVFAKVLSTPSGWTFNTSTAGFVAQRSIWPYTRRASSEPSSYTLAVSGVNTDFPSMMIALSGADPTTLLDAEAQGGSASTTTSPVAPSVTTTQSNSMIVCAFIYGNSSAFTPPAGMTTIGTVVGGASGYNMTACYALQAVAGASGTKTATIGTASGYDSKTIAIRGLNISSPFWTDKIRSVEVDS